MKGLFFIGFIVIGLIINTYAINVQVNELESEHMLDVNRSLIQAQEVVLNDVQTGRLINDAQVDAAVKVAFEHIFSKCENILEPKKQKQCLLDVAQAKKVTSKGCKAKIAKGSSKKNDKKKDDTKAAEKAKEPVKVEKKDEVAQDADKVKKYEAKATKFTKLAQQMKEKADKYAQQAKEATEKMKKDVEKKDKENKDLLNQVSPAAAQAQAQAPVQPPVQPPTQAQTPAQTPQKQGQEQLPDPKAAAQESASFISEFEFQREMAAAEYATSEANDMSRETLMAFIELSAESMPHLDLEDHLESINLSEYDLNSLDIPDLNDVEDVDQLVDQSKNLVASKLISFAEVDEETEETHDNEEEEHEEESEDNESHEQSFVETEHKDPIVAAAEAEMHAALDAKPHDVIDLSDLPPLPDF